MNFAFTILNEGDKAKTASGNYTAGVFDAMDENCSELQLCLAELITQIEDLNAVEIENETYQIKKFFGANLKELSIIFDINAANSNQPCIWF